MDRTVTTTLGPVEGRVETDAHVYRGVPYGQAERFAPAIPAIPWLEARDASHIGTRAMQATPPAALAAEQNPFQDLAGYFVGDDPKTVGLQVEPTGEDCLVLNVVTPNPAGAARPVMVYVHGGGFSTGSAAMIPQATRLAVEEDVVLVGVNHRLNVFGYLHLADLDESFAGSGNVGQLDLVLALEWVRDNIASFGGDPNNVTIFGESGGGRKISALMGMPEAQGLFHKAIIQSGSRLGALTRDQATRTAAQLLEHLEAKPDDLRTIPADQLLAAAAEARLVFGPVVDGRLIPRAPFDPDASPLSATIPLLVGHCLDELSMFDAIGQADSMLERMPLTGPERGRILATYEAAFPDIPERRRMMRLLGDWTFGNAANAQAERKAAQPPAVFKYLFTYEPPVVGGTLGAFHTAELPLVMRLVRFPDSEPLSRALASAWASFARTGDPSTDDLAWPRFDIEQRNTMIFDSAAHVVADPYAEIRSAWTGVPHDGIEVVLQHADR